MSTAAGRYGGLTSRCKEAQPAEAGSACDNLYVVRPAPCAQCLPPCRLLTARTLAGRLLHPAQVCAGGLCAGACVSSYWLVQLQTLTSACVQPAPDSEETIFLSICAYFDRLLSIARPRRLLYLALGAVATAGWAQAGSRLDAKVTCRRSGPARSL